MKYIASILFSALLFSCGTGKEVKETKEIEVQAQEEEITENTIHEKWELEVIGNTPVSGSKVISLEFTEDNKVTGFIGCNNLIGSYTIENESQIKFDQLGTTKKICPENEMETEKQMLELLNTVDNFTVVDGVLKLNVGKRAALASFKKMSVNEIVNKHWKLTKLAGQEIEANENPEKEPYFMLNSEGIITGFAGCNQFNGMFELKEGMRISFNENMAVTMKSCLDSEFNESAFLEVFKLADNYTVNGETLQLNVGKRAPLAVFEAVN